MYHASLHYSIDAPWTGMESIKVGSTSAFDRTPDAFIVVEREGKAFARIDVFSSRDGAFTALVPWGRYVVFGHADVVHLIDPATRMVQSMACDDYFGHVYPLPERLLVASATSLICLDHNGGTVWRSSRLGIDGVVVECVEDGCVIGKGECDPPGGWQPFKISLVSGQPVG
jgi:hypothetical protein